MTGGNVRPPLVGSLVRLRATEPDDEPLLYRWFNDPEVTRHLTTRYPVSHEMQRNVIADQSTPGYEQAFFVIEWRDGGRAIGTCDLTTWRPEVRTARLGIAIGEATFRGRRFGTDTVRTLCRFGFQMMNLHRIELDVFADNERAIRVYEKVGFRREGLRRDAYFSHGRYRDIVVMGLLEGELIDGPAPSGTA
jgi:RimJ/RimL family protein N-acetyltransferase